MPKTAISDPTLRALPVPQKGQADYWDAELPSFGVRVSQGGSKTFVLKPHNVRRAIGRTFATKMAQLGAAPHVIERILNHVTGTLSPIGLIYNRA